LNSVMYYLVESLRHIGIMLQPILIESSAKLFEQLNIPKNLQTWESLEFGLIEELTVTSKPVPLFPRLDKKVEEDYLKDLLNNKVDVEEIIEEEDFITIEDFNKIDLVVGEILESKVHPNADKLLVSQIDTGDKVRQIVSGISKFYKPEDLIGKKVIVVKNLKPVKLRGVLSEGMVLAGKNKKTLEVIESTSLNKGDIIS
ncbi:MAG: methionine--tRNA ligase subunit beta, partial [Candidatus Izemoplasma sp.]